MSARPKLLLLILGVTACGQDPELHYVDVGVDVRLNAVAEADWDQFMAVGSGGVIVDQHGRHWDLGAVELRDVAFSEDGVVQRWLVVGDHGTAAYAQHPPFLYDPPPTEWTNIELGTQADLHAALFWNEYQMVIAGDEVLLVNPLAWYEPGGEPELTTWLEPSAPPGGWGRLRTLFTGPGPRLWAAGEQGRLLWAEDDLTSWTVDDTQTNRNLRAGGERDGRMVVVGDDGTMLTALSSGWMHQSLGTQHDLLGWGFGIIDSSGAIRTVHWREGKPISEILLRFDWQPRDIGAFYIVGDRGNVVYYSPPVGYL